MAGKRIKCTDKEIIEASETTMSAFEASRKLGINYKTYRTYAIKLNCFKTNQSGKGMDKKSIHKPGYEFNEHYFDDIDSNEKAYFLGFIAADGGVERQKGPLSFSLQKRDKEILIKFCECIGYDTSHVGEYTSGFLYKDTWKIIEACHLKLCSKYLAKSLSNYNIIPAKSNIDNNLFYNIPDKYKYAWLAGYIDGDGHIGKESYAVEIVSNYKTIINIYDFLKLDLKIEGKIRQIGKITYTLVYHKKEYVRKILDKYLHESPIHLTRKEETAKNIIERQERIEKNKKTKINYVKKNNDKDCNNKDEDMKREKKYCIDCGKPISQDATRCKRCAQIHKAFQKRPNRPDRETLKNLIRNDSFLSIGKQYGVTDNAIRKWCKVYGLPYKVSEIKKISDEEWENI